VCGKPGRKEDGRAGGWAACLPGGGDREVFVLPVLPSS
jgi:hypothetical protein